MDRTDLIGIWALIFLLFAFVPFLIPVGSESAELIYSVWLVVWVILFVNIFIQAYMLDRDSRNDSELRKLMDERLVFLKEFMKHRFLWVIFVIYLFLVPWLRGTKYPWLGHVIGMVFLAGIFIYYRIKWNKTHSSK